MEAAPFVRVDKGPQFNRLVQRLSCDVMRNIEWMADLALELQGTLRPR